MSPRARALAGRRARSLLLAVSLAGTALIANVPSAGAAITIGQLGTPPSPQVCEVLVDRVQPTVTSGNSYVLPSTGGVTDWTITSWSSNPPGPPATTAWKAKIFRQVAPGTFTVVAQDQVRNLTTGTLNTFTTALRAKPGDILGVNVIANAVPCSFVVTGDSYLRTGPGSDLANGASGAFPIATLNRRLNISAVATPTSTFDLSKGKANKKKGIGKLEVEDILNPGELVLSGKGVTRATENVNPGDDEVLKVRAKGGKSKKLNSTGKTTLKPKVTFTPSTGEPNTESKKLKLKKN